MCTDICGGSAALRIVGHKQRLTGRVFPARAGLKRLGRRPVALRCRVPRARGAEAITQELKADYAKCSPRARG